ncbi:MAG: GxxExxY protein [Candidatus Magasanikbacteria bacterium CG_4_9_14_0_2_um_filter_42_11]|uniref:GxxExxY protein n=1 Tax=Candidatus Magasanikbacteria bacterium CG_4_9_14_0_2_um_filter_42_11 TaxID=1974643 RepID=A0A2M8FAC9_9BACT|nr:MAG: GxxExxY protein [Candidatus Magasanikbacteria bacterium CG10_big_fil_rev_8_21_14_0_10_43_9]PIY92225.1 MAG: GxxExxY protein [Candidatus Magasanikbacteria bacterium CG_4_10_14_0_8_um_filter_42_12]PJC52695.1 MAG: GxxExxY protein [Candidatus Magasanikbacteria bacterium CG_4_9_14_0_2_um_filter_42_11]
MNVSQVKRKDLLYPELSYIINGALFEVYKELGGGHKEVYYQKAMALALKEKGISYIEQYSVPLTFKGSIVGKYYLDFLVEDKIILELKRGKLMPYAMIQQTKEYLIATNLQLAIIGCFTHQGAYPKRIINHELLG